MKILVIEDDQNIASSIADALKRQYFITIAATGQEGEFLALTTDYNLIILDLNLPDKNGLTVCRNLRKTGLKTPLLILTGETGTRTKVELLDSGADDYLTKPFRFAELAARIRALLRRENRLSSTNTIIVGDITLDLDKKIVRREKRIVRLRKKEYYLLEYLVRNAGNVVSRNMILDNVWEDEMDGQTNVVDVHIKYLRDRLDKPFGKKSIKTIHGLGYKFIDKYRAFSTDV